MLVLFLLAVRASERCRFWSFGFANAFSCSWPASAAKVTVMSLPNHFAIWFTTSGITGLTWSGLIDEPAWRVVLIAHSVLRIPGL
jgi:hypothetical protein